MGNDNSYLPLHGERIKVRGKKENYGTSN